MAAADIAELARDVHNHIALGARAYTQLQAALVEHRREAYREGGVHAVEDFGTVAGPDVVRQDLVAFMVACGLGDVLVAANGRKDHRRLTKFHERYERLVATDGLTTYRGQQNPDPLSGARRTPGVEIK